MLRSSETAFSIKEKHDLSDNKTDIHIPPAVIDTLQQTEDLQIRQEILDGIFTNERREAILQTASKDFHGRPVRYFRFMPYDKFLRMAKEGKQTPLQYFEDPEQLVDSEDFKYFLQGYREHLNPVNIWSGSLESESLDNVMKNLFTKTVRKEEQESLLNNPTYSRVQEFVKRNIDLDYVKGVHTSSLGQEFSPLLSLSVGGPITALIDSKRVYVEMILPDNLVEIRPSSYQDEVHEREKEVYTTQIPLDTVTRIYASENALREREIINPDTAVGKTYKQIVQQKGWCSTDTAVGVWRTNEKTKDYLPVSLRYK